MKVQAIKNYFPSYKFLKIFQIIKILMYETNNISEYKKKMSNDDFHILRRKNLPKPPSSLCGKVNSP